MREFVGDEGVPDVEGAREHVLGYLVSFARALRRGGAEVPANASVVAARALVEVGLGDHERVRVALRSALVTREEDLATFDQLFPSFWRQLTGEDDEYVAPEQGAESPVPGRWSTPAAEASDPSTADGEPTEGDVAAVDRSVEPGDSAPDGEADAATVTASVYSPAGRPRPVAVAPPADADSRLATATRRLEAAIASLRGRRWARSGDERADTRRALRRSVGTGGAVLSVPRRDRQRSAVRATIFVDVSQSVLDVVDRAFLLGFLRLVRNDWRDVRVFFFDTSVREVTDAFDAPTTAAAAEALERAEAEWGGGTRIGHAIETVRREHPDAVDRETVVFVISDGLEVGELEVLASGASWLSRRAGALLWLNPLAGSPEYEPTCRGMELALPYLDGLFAFASPEDVEEVARQLERQGLGGRVGFEYDPRRLDGGQ